jgi:hypothetical protein
MRWIVLVAVVAWFVSPDVQRFVWQNGMLVAVAAVVLGVAMYARDRFGGIGQGSRIKDSSPGRAPHYRRISPGTVVSCTCNDPSCW